jgi:hypothetical protein
VQLTLSPGLVAATMAAKGEFCCLYFFGRIPLCHFSARSVQSCLIGDLTGIYSPKGWRARPFEPEVVVTLVLGNEVWTSVDFMEEGQ